MDTLLTIGTIVIGLLVVGPFLARVVVAFQKGMAEIETLESLARHTRDEGAQAIEQLAVIENDLSGLMRERDEYQTRLKALEEAISPAKLASRARVFMATDRYSKWDEEYYARIVNNTMDTSTFHANAVESWVRGRRHVFWAATEQDVRMSIEARFPSALGYDLVALEVSKDRLFDLEGDAKADNIPNETPDIASSDPALIAEI
jgi:hypothetical protein